MKIASAQIDVLHGQPDQNLERLTRVIEGLDPSTDLVLFPEAFLTGYSASNKDDALGMAIDGSKIFDSIQAVVDRTNVGVIVGYARRQGAELFNEAGFFLPKQPSQHYRKTHLPFMGLDRFASSGDSIRVWDSPWGKIGILICYDMRFPEAARTLALGGADLVVVITNWPTGAESSANHIAIARAAENRVFVATCNRIGEEGGFRFIGGSKIIGIDGSVLASAGEEEAVLYATIELADARQKRRIVIPGEYETDLIADRRTDLYFTREDAKH